MRLAAFVVTGLIVGGVCAWLRGPARIANVAPAPPLARVKLSHPVASPSSAGFGYRVQVAQRELSPSDARYDPVARMGEEAGLTSKEIFESEPRDPAFAPVLERRVQAAVDVIARELVLTDKIRKIQVECRTLSCYTVIQVSRDELEEVYNQVNGILLGDLQTPGMSSDADSELGLVTLYDVYRPATRDDAYYKKFLDEAMRGPLEFVKQQLAQRRSADQGRSESNRSGGAP